MFNTASPRRKGRYLAAIAALGVTVGLLAGCSASGNGNGSTTITLSMQQTDVKTGDPTTWAVVQAFEKKYPKIHVTVTGQPVAQHNQAISVAAQSGTLPEIFWVVDGTTGAKLSKSGALMNLDPMLKSLGLTSKIAPNVLAKFKQGNTQYGVPYQALVTGLYYNKKILQDNGLSAPTTFDQLLTIANTLKAKGITTISNGANQSAFSVWSFLTSLSRFGFDDKVNGLLAGTEKFSNPDFINYYTTIQQLQKAGAFSSNVATQTYNQAVSAFADGKAAFLDSGVWASSQLQSSSVGSNTGFWIGPQFSNGVGNQDIAMNVVGAPLAVSGSIKSGTPAYDAVEKFIGFYFSDEGQQIFADNGQPPVTDYQPKVDPKNTVFQAVLDAVKGKATPLAQPDQYLPTPVQNALYDSIYGVIEGQLTPQAAADLVQKALDTNK